MATPNLLLPTLVEGQAQTEITINTSLTYLDSVVAGFETVNVAGSANVTLTEAQVRNSIFRLTGTLTGNIQFIVPARERWYVILNDTTGAFTVTVKTAAGTGVVVPQTTSMMVYCDATNVGTAIGSGGGISGLITNSIPYAASATSIISDPSLMWDSTPAKALSLGQAGGTVSAAADRVKLSVADTNGVAGKAGLLITTEDGTQHVFGHNVLLGTTVSGTGLVKGVVLGAGTAPSTSPADAIQLWVADLAAVAGKSSLYLRTEDDTQHVFGNSVGLGVTSDLASGSRLHVRGADGEVGNVTFDNFIDATSGPTLTARHSRGTVLARTRVNALDSGGGLRIEAWARDATDTADDWMGLALITGVVESVDAQGRLASAIWFRNSSGASAAVSSKARITSLGNFCLGTTNAGTNAAFTIMLGPGTAPTTSPTDSVQIWGADRGGTAGKRALHVMAEDLTTHVFGDLSGIATTSPQFTLHVNGRLACAVPNSATGVDTGLSNGQMSLYLDAGETTLTFRVRTSAGTLKTGTIAIA